MAHIQRPPDDLFHNRKSFVDTRDALAPYLRKAYKSLSEKERMELKLQISCCEAVIGHIKESEELLRDCQAYILEHGREEEKATIYHILCRLEIHHSRFADGLAHGLKALYLFKQLPFPFFTMTTSTCCGVACSNLNLFTEAIDHLTESHKIALSIDDPRSAILATANLNEARIRILPVEDCIAYNKEMLNTIYAEYGEKPSMAECATSVHLGYLYSKQKNYTLASSYADRALSVVSHFDYLPPYHFLYTNIYALKAEVAGGLGDEKTMLKHAEECNSRARQVQKASPEIDTCFILFRYYLDHHNLKKAKAYLDRATALIPEPDRGSQFLDLTENRCLYFAAIGDTAQELHHFKLIYEYKIKAQQEGLNNRINYINTVHALELKQKEVEQHKSEIEYKTQELNMTNYHLQQRTQLLTDLRANIVELKRGKYKSDVVYRTITKTIDQAFVKEEVEKDRFREKFDEAQRGFIARLHLAYPALSPTECRVCALLRSGFNTKDMASLLSTSPRNVENHRVAIRRKMGLNREDNLNLVLTTIE
jgi:DNA-binding NarL/FixJ family response regulator